jgi:CTP:molybdopterin cytidylyltransferase MocA
VKRPGPALVVLAAGASTRLGESKALVELRPGRGGTALEVLLEAGAALGDPHPLVISGRDHASLEQRLGEHVELRFNERWAEGRLGSLWRALEARPGRDLCVAPVDVPLVSAAVFAALREEWLRNGAPSQGWLAPFVWRAGERAFGHPIVIGQALARIGKDFPPDSPLRLLRERARPRFALATSDEAILDDLDTREDLERLRRVARQG